MANTEASVSHDHDYCCSKVEEEKAIDFVVENLLNSSSVSSPKSVDAEIKEMGSSVCLSPAYSCDSGIDSFANDLVRSFDDEGEDLLNFLLDDDFDLDTTPNFTKSLSTNSGKTEVKTVTESPIMKTEEKSVGKKTSNDNDEVSMFDKNRKNAENAKENRRKKKMYVEGLEKEVGQLRNEKNVLTVKANKWEKKVNELQTEVDYLKSVLANQSMLSKLIENVSTTPGVSLSTSFCSSRQSSLRDNNIESEKENTVSTRSSRKRASDSQPAPSAKRGRGSSTNALGGVCLHVNQSKVSLEFCPHCSKMAKD